MRRPARRLADRPERGNIHTTSYGAVNRVSSRAVANGNSTVISGGLQHVLYRGPPPP